MRGIRDVDTRVAAHAISARQPVRRAPRAIARSAPSASNTKTVFVDRVGDEHLRRWPRLRRLNGRQAARLRCTLRRKAIVDVAARQNAPQPRRSAVDHEQPRLRIEGDARAAPATTAAPDSVPAAERRDAASAPLPAVRDTRGRRRPTARPRGAAKCPGASTTSIAAERQPGARAAAPVDEENAVVRRVRHEERLPGPGARPERHARTDKRGHLDRTAVRRARARAPAKGRRRRWTARPRVAPRQRPAVAQQSVCGRVSSSIDVQLVEELPAALARRHDELERVRTRQQVDAEQQQVDRRLCRR